MNCLARQIRIQSRMLLKFKISSFNSIIKQTATQDKDEDKTKLVVDETLEEVEFKNATESFLQSINKADDYDTKEDDKSIDRFLKSFNQRINKQNEELTNKIKEIAIDKSIDDSSKQTSVFATVNEINKLNIFNTSKLLKMFLSEILKFQRESNKNNRHRSSYFNYETILFTMKVTVLAWLAYMINEKYNSISPSKLAEMIAVDKSRLTELQILSSSNKEALQIFGTHSICFSDLPNDNIFVVGESNICKSASLLKNAVIEAEKGSFVLYVDLSSNFAWSDIRNEMDLLIKVIKSNNRNLSYKLSKLDSSSYTEFHARLSDLLKNKKKLIIFDNADLEVDSRMIELIPKLNKLQYKAIVSSNSISVLLPLISKASFQNYNIQCLKLDEQLALGNLRERHNLTEIQIDEIRKYLKLSSLKHLDKILKTGANFDETIECFKTQTDRELQLLKEFNPSSYQLLSDLNAGKIKELKVLPYNNVRTADIQLLENKGLIKFANSNYEFCSGLRI